MYDPHTEHHQRHQHRRRRPGDLKLPALRRPEQVRDPGGHPPGQPAQASAGGGRGHRVRGGRHGRLLLCQPGREGPSGPHPPGQARPGPHPRSPVRPHRRQALPCARGLQPALRLPRPRQAEISPGPLGEQAAQRALCRPHHRRQPRHPGQPDRGGHLPQKDHRGHERRGPCLSHLRRGEGRPAPVSRPGAGRIHLWHPGPH